MLRRIARTAAPVARAAGQRPARQQPARRGLLRASRPARAEEEELEEKVDAAKARRMEKAREVAERRAAEKKEVEDSKARAYERQKEAYFRAKKGRDLSADVRVNGSREHLDMAELRRVMRQADKEIAVEHLPPLEFAPELYSGKNMQSRETALSSTAQQDDFDARVEAGQRAKYDQQVPEVYDERLLRKYGFKLPEIVHIHSSFAKKKVSTGNQLKRKTILVAGNGKGLIGWGVGKSTDEYQSWLTAYSRCLENALVVPLSENRTLPHPVIGKFKRTRVMILPAPRGTGIMAGRSIHPILECAGIQDAMTKVIGRRNPYNVVLAVFDGLRQAVSRQDMAEGRGKKVHDFLDPGDYKLVSPPEADMDAQFDKACEAIDRAMVMSVRIRAQMRREADAEAKEELAGMSAEQLVDEIKA